MSLPTSQRLRRTREFAAVRAEGRSWSGRCLIVAVRPRPEFTSPHAGFTTTRRLGNAVVRNKIRRRLRAIVREFMPSIRVSHDIVTIAKFPAAKAEYAELRKEWARLAGRAGLFGSPPLPAVTRPAAEGGQGHASFS